MEEKKISALPTRREIVTEILKKAMGCADNIEVKCFICNISSKFSMDRVEIISVLDEIKKFSEEWEVVCEEKETEEEFLFKFVGIRKNNAATAGVKFAAGVKLKKITFK